MRGLGVFQRSRYMDDLFCKTDVLMERARKERTEINL
jgi:hypothetical protein